MHLRDTVCIKVREEWLMLILTAKDNFSKNLHVFIANLRQLYLFIKIRLFTCVCCSFYGSPLCTAVVLNSAAVQSLCVG